MDELDYWRLCESLNAYNAAALITGQSPALLHGGEMHGVYMAISPFDAQPSRLDHAFQAALAAIKGAIIKRSIKANLVHKVDKVNDYNYEEDYGSTRCGELEGGCEQEGAGGAKELCRDIDWQDTTVDVEDLRIWLKGRGFTTGFFFPGHEEAQAGYLDKDHPNYAPKLAAAIRAWEAVTSDPERLRGKTPKQAITKWLNEHAAAYGLTKDDGTPNATGVEEAAKLANWKPEGGASKTPSKPLSD